MIRVTIELLPGGLEAGKSVLGTVTIGNNLSSTDRLNRGNYNVRLSMKGRPDSSWRRGRVQDFPRLRLGAYDLLYRALRETVGERNA